MAERSAWKGSLKVREKKNERRKSRCPPAIVEPLRATAYLPPVPRKPPNVLLYLIVTN